MSPSIYDCIVCGYPFHDVTEEHDPRYYVSWMQQFRVILSNGSLDDTCVTGVGLYDNPRDNPWTAPLDYDVRWNDAGAVRADDYGVMAICYEDGRHGFVLHDACWSLLQQACQTERPSSKRLTEICLSLPFPVQFSGLDWGHDYGGLALVEENGIYPWQKQLSDRGIHDPLYACAQQDPSDASPIRAILESAPDAQPPGNPVSTFGPAGSSHDPFFSLPVEIRLLIASSLATSDYYALRQASRAFIPLFSIQQFWASRFAPAAERGFLSQFCNDKEPRHWRSLYRCTTKAQIPPMLRNSRRIWGLVQSLKELINMRLEHPSYPIEGDPTSCQHNWTQVTGDLRHPISSDHRPFREGCCVLYRQDMLVPDHLQQIAVSFVQPGDVQYVSGLRFIAEGSQDIVLGYSAGKNETILDATNLQGFVLAVAPRGIRAIQLVNFKGNRTGWAGNHSGSPITQRLTIRRPISALQIGVDGYKVVSIAMKVEGPLRGSKTTVHQMSLQDTALWYPGIPDPAQYLNMDSFLGGSDNDAYDQPLCFIHFGGPGGTYLSYMTGISVSFDKTLIRGIAVHFDGHDPPIEQRVLGSFGNPHDETRHFPIDGRKGELIEMIETNVELVQWFSKGLRRTLQSVLIRTNMGRSYHFLPPEREPDATEPIAPSPKPYVVAKGTTITGLYAAENFKIGLGALGVVSEVLG